MRRLFGSGEHLMRVVLLFAAGLLVFLGLKAALVPKGFGVYGHYRAGALDDNRARPVAFAGRTACGDCHDDKPPVLAKGRHATVGCEACHGPLAAHIEDSEAPKPVRPPVPGLCLRCHGKTTGRPAAFPQIVPADHAGDTRCTECHSPHDPERQP